MMGSSPRPTTSKSQLHASGVQGSPVEASTRSWESAFAGRARSPEAISTRVRVGEMPRWVTPLRSATDQTRRGSGKSGAPS